MKRIETIKMTQMPNGINPLTAGDITQYGEVEKVDGDLIWFKGWQFPTTWSSFTAVPVVAAIPVVNTSGESSVSVKPQNKFMGCTPIAEIVSEHLSKEELPCIDLTAKYPSDLLMKTLMGKPNVDFNSDAVQKQLAEVNEEIKVVMENSVPDPKEMNCRYELSCIDASKEDRELEEAAEELSKRIPYDVPLLAYKSAVDKCMKGELKIINRDYYRTGFYNGFLTAWQAHEEQSANDTVDFVTFINKECFRVGEDTWAIMGEGGKYAIPDLFKHWKEQKIKPIS